MVRFESKKKFLFQSLYAVGIFILIFASPDLVAGQALKSIHLLSSSVSTTNTPSYFARDKKFFEQEGLSVRIVTSRTEVALAALLGRSADYSTFAPSSIEATLRGVPIRVVAITGIRPDWAIIVNDRIKQMRDLKGKKIASSTFGGGYPWLAALRLETSWD